MAEAESTTKQRLTRDMMAARITAEFQDGWIANLGVGMPTMCSDFLPADKQIILHSENGLIGYGRNATVEEATPYVVNAGVMPVLLAPYAAIVHHADAFAVIRSGRLDVGVLGAYEVAMNGDFANWKTDPNKLGGGIGGGMDIAICAQRIFLLMEHQTRDGRPRLLKRCNLPLTAEGVVKLVMTDLGLFQPAGDHFVCLELAPGFSIEEVQAVSEAPVVAAPDIHDVTMG
ncbi:MAG TPA: CoA-transferase [Dehalococcoidia bacterium]|jgi:3-oxoacid CoA-transferase B subunit|nr:CoA-transferase [Dehalococcoidia bacterium]